MPTDKPLYMAMQAWAVIYSGRLDIRTVKVDRLNAITAWLVIRGFVYEDRTDEEIEAYWEKTNSGAIVVPVRIEMLNEASPLDHSDLRDLAKRLQEVAHAHPCYSQAHRIVSNCCDHLCAVAGVNELNQTNQEKTRED